MMNLLLWVSYISSGIIAIFFHKNLAAEGIHRKWSTQKSASKR